MNNLSQNITADGHKGPVMCNMMAYNYRGSLIRLPTSCHQDCTWKADVLEKICVLNTTLPSESTFIQTKWVSGHWPQARAL